MFGYTNCGHTIAVQCAETQFLSFNTAKFSLFFGLCRFGSRVDLNRTRHQKGSRPRGTPCPWLLSTSHSYLPSVLSLSVPTPILPFLFFCSSPVLWASTLPHFSTLSFSCSCALYPTHASRRCALCHFQYDSLHHSPFLSYVSSNTLPTCIPNPFSNSQLFFEGVQQQKKSPFLRESSAKKTCQTPLEIISPTRSWCHVF